MIIDFIKIKPNAAMKKIYLFLFSIIGINSLFAQVKPEYVLQDKLWSAIVNNNQAEIKNLLKQGAKLNEKTYQNTYPLLEAVKHAKAETVKYLIDNGADVNVKNDYNETAMNFSLNNKSIINSTEVINESEVIKMVQYLTDAGADVDNVDQFGRTTFADAVWEKQLKLAKKLLDLGARVDFVHPKTGTTTLTWICRYSNVKSIQFLLDNGADINHKDNENNNALYEAAIYNNADNVKILMEKGADPFIKVGSTNALKNSINNEFWEVVKIILSHIEDINFNYEDRGYGLVHEAVINDNAELLKIMIALGADLNQKNKFGSSPLSLAYYNKNQTIIDLLEDAGAKK